MPAIVSAASRFLDLVWGDRKRPEDWLLLWEKNGKRSHWFQSLSAASEFAAGKVDLYVGCGLSGTDNGPSKRATESQIVAIPGLWADVDFGGNVAHKSANLPPDEESAKRLIDSLGIPPTLIVHSGFGLQPWWLLESPLLLSDAESRRIAKAASQALQDALIASGKVHGWKVDSVGDLARILRLPGTLNGKGDPAPEVRLIMYSWTRYAELPRFTIQAIDAAQAPNENNGHGSLKFDENPEANTVIGRPPEHWERIAAGVNHDTRNVDMTSLCGKLFQAIADPFNRSSVEVQWLCVQAINDRNQPPLDTKELRTIFNSILRTEQNKRSEKNHDAAYQQVVVTEAEERPWKLVDIQRLPVSFLLASKFWPGNVELTADQLANWSKLRLAVLEQKRCHVEKRYAGIWEKSTDNRESLLTKLLREREVRPAGADENRDSRLALAILAALMTAPIREISSSTREQPCRQQDGSVVFGFRWLAGEINRAGTSKITEEAVARMLAAVRCGDIRHENVRFKSLSKASEDHLRRISDGEEIVK